MVVKVRERDRSLLNGALMVVRRESVVMYCKIMKLRKTGC